MLNIFDQITYFQIEIMEKHLGNDLKERRLKFELLNVHEFYSELDELDRVALKKSITNINPSLMCCNLLLRQVGLTVCLRTRGHFSRFKAQKRLDDGDQRKAN